MFEILERDDLPSYMDPVAQGLLTEARKNFERFGFREHPILQTGDHSFILALRYGTVKATTLSFALGGLGFVVEQHDGFLIIDAADAACTLPEALSDFADGKIPDLFAHGPNLIFAKFHAYLTRELLEADALSSMLAIPAVPEIGRKLTGMVLAIQVKKLLFRACR